MTLLNKLNELKDWDDLFDLSDICNWIRESTNLINIKVRLDTLDLKLRNIIFSIFTDSNSDENMKIFKLNDIFRDSFPHLLNYNIRFKLADMSELYNDVNIHISDYLVEGNLIVEYNGIKQYLIFDKKFRRVGTEFKTSLLGISVSNKYSNINQYSIINFNNDDENIKKHIKQMIYDNLSKLIKHIFIDSELDYYNFIKHIKSNLKIKSMLFNELVAEDMGLLCDYLNTIDKDSIELLNQSYYGKLIK